jgi:hypothetical protein
MSPIHSGTDVMLFYMYFWSLSPSLLVVVFSPIEAADEVTNLLLLLPLTENESFSVDTDDKL